MKRVAFIPDNYKLPVVLGWRSPDGNFLADQPISSTDDGLFVPVKVSEDTPTEPPPPPGEMLDLDLDAC